MFTYLRRLAAVFMRTRGPFHPFNPPSDPYAGVREPRRPKPGGGRSAAVAVDEPAPPAVVNAVTRNRTLALALLAAGGLLAAPAVGAQNTNSSEKPFVSGGRIDIQLAGGGYQIFGNVTVGMDVVDQIVNAPNDGSEGGGGSPLSPVIMRTVTIQRP